MEVEKNKWTMQSRKTPAPFAGKCEENARTKKFWVFKKNARTF